ncbi:M42 family peptidase [Clostridium neuense]|uniref:M42 family peptidase n=1 Tax=Clostridium neuense TaxID=1728934 RepID=A0ABW8TQK7_9CLOT
MDKLLKDIIEVFGVSGHENQISQFIKQQLKDIKCELKEDKLGNIIVKRGSGEKRVMISANMDVKGLITYCIEENGNVRVHNLGDIEAEKVVNKFVEFEGGISGEVLSDVKEKHEFRDLYVDLGFKTREAALKYVKEGDAACFKGNTYEEDNNIISPNLSNRIGCYIMLKLIRDVRNYNKEVYFVFSTQGELEARGARAAAFDVKPNLCLVLNTENEKYIKLGKGPAVIVMQKGLIMHSKIKEMIIDEAKKMGMDIQLCVSDEMSDGSTVHKEVIGIPTGTVAVPCQNKGTLKETADLKDVQKTIDLIKNCLNKI